MSILGKKIPEFLRAKYQLIATVTFTALFSVVFMLVTIPFSRNAWFGLGGSKSFAFTAAFFVLSLLIIIISKRVMYATRGMIQMTYLQYILWNMGEVVLISVMYTCFTLQGETLGIISLENSNFWYVIYRAFCYCLVSLIFPYILAGMFFALADMTNTIRLMNTSDVVSDEASAPSKGVQKITLYDNNGVMKLSVSLSNLFYIESDDNYIIVWYSDNKGNLKKYMIRCRLKTVEESFRGSSLVRCHRKYIVNMDKVKVLRKEKDGYELDLENDAIPPISITKTYAENVLSRFTPKAS
ncbi:MAG: LytR/AlgR family response regulator transcription factor [Candidatus Cryptobacteroides sp.]